MKKTIALTIIMLPLLLFAGGNPGNPLRKFTVEDTVRWVLTGVERSYNAGLAQDMLLRFAPTYADVNGVNFTKLGTMLPKLLASVKEGDKPFMFYNASATVNGNNAVLTATILLRPTGVSVGGQGLLVAKDTIELTRLNGKWLIKSAPKLMAAFTEAIVIDSTYRFTHQGGNDAK